MSWPWNGCWWPPGWNPLPQHRRRYRRRRRKSHYTLGMCRISKGQGWCWSVKMRSRFSCSETQWVPAFWLEKGMDKVGLIRYLCPVEYALGKSVEKDDRLNGEGAEQVPEAAKHPCPFRHFAWVRICLWYALRYGYGIVTISRGERQLQHEWHTPWGSCTVVMFLMYSNASSSRHPSSKSTIFVLRIYAQQATADIYVRST